MLNRSGLSYDSVDSVTKELSDSINRIAVGIRYSLSVIVYITSDFSPALILGLPTKKPVIVI